MTGKQFELFLWDVRMELDQKLRLIKNLENYLYCKTVQAVAIGKNANRLFKKSFASLLFRRKILSRRYRSCIYLLLYHKTHIIWEKY